MPATKDAVGTALGTSRLWFTVAQGIVTEVYYPRPDIPQLKDMGFIVGDGAGFWVELRRMTWHYAEAGPGEVALTEQLPRAGTLALICG